MHFNGRNDAIKFVDDYDSMILEAKKENLLKNQGLATALVKVKAENT